MPESLDTANKHPDEFTEDMIGGTSTKEGNAPRPYITAKFPHRDIPYTFHLGDAETYEGYTNRKLEKGKRYRIFVRAIVDTPRKVGVSGIFLSLIHTGPQKKKGKSGQKFAMFMYFVSPNLSVTLGFV